MGRLYKPSWWERKFPWMLDVLAALDPDPLAARVSTLFEPLRDLFGRCAEPVAAILDAIGRASRVVWSALIGGVERLLAELPLPRAVRRGLWLEAPALHRDGVDHAQLVLKRQYSVLVPVFLIVAVGVHVAAIIYSPTLRAADLSIERGELVAVSVPPAIEVPPPPPSIGRPATPVVGTTAIDEEVTIAPTTFEAFVPEVAPLEPPPVEERVEDVPSLDNVSLIAVILNREEILQLMVREYPSRLRDAGVGGSVGVLALIDTAGNVEDVRVEESSGYDALDEAALRIARRMKCSPAVQADRTVTAWVRTTIAFRVR